MTIVCGIDFSEVSEHAARVAAAWAKALGAKLVLLSCADDLPITAGPGILTPVTELNDLRLQGLRNALEAMATALDHDEIEVRAVSGSPPQRIAEEAAKTKAELIVVGSHGRSALAGLLLGHVADRVVRLADRPVLIVRGDFERLEDWPKTGAPLKVTVAVDFDGTSGRAIEMLRTLRGIGPCDIVLTHVYRVPETVPTFTTDAAGDPARVEENIEAGLRTRLLDLVRDLPGEGSVEVYLAPTWGPVAELVRREVEATRPDLLLTGTHGRSGLSLLWHGSVTQALIHHTRISVLTAPAPEARGKET